ncbi:MAG: SurA N-terminal domain-containing protein [Bacillota bacterium]
MKKGLVLLIGLMFIFALTACNNEDSEDEETNDTVIATVNDEEIYESTWKKSVDRMMLSYQQQGIDVESEQGQMFVEQIETQALDQLINQTLLYQEAKADDFVVDETEAQAELTEIKEGYDSDEEFATALESNLFTEDELLELLKIELSITAYLDATLDEVTVTEEEKEAYYDDYKEEADDEEEIPPYEDVEENIEAQLISQAEQAQVSEIISTLKESSEIENNL